VNEEVYKSLARCLRTACTRHGGAYRHLAGQDVLRLEFAPLINRIISPPLRPVSIYATSILVSFVADRILCQRLINKSSSLASAHCYHDWWISCLPWRFDLPRRDQKKGNSCTDWIRRSQTNLYIPDTIRLTDLQTYRYFRHVRRKTGG
jgi:hypothetical protein